MILPVLMSEAEKIKAALAAGGKSRAQKLAAVGSNGLRAGMVADTGIHARLGDRGQRAIGR